MTVASNENEMHSTLIDDYFELLNVCAKSGSIIDLACGGGRNGLFLANKGLPVIFSDRSENALKIVSNTLTTIKGESKAWLVDLEQQNFNPLEGKQFSAALIFRYLHRPLMPALLESIIPGGLIIYETFTIDNRQFGRPNNKDFLLQSGELKNYFNNWEILHYFEGILSNPDRAIAQIVCRKPIKNNGI